jgi:hypothetical protein
MPKQTAGGIGAAARCVHPITLYKALYKAQSFALQKAEQL